MKHGPYKKGEQFRSVINPQKAQKFLNWKPEISLPEGLHLTVDYFKSIQV
jgi:UDP-glucose 4-epimerase